MTPYFTTIWFSLLNGIFLLGGLCGEKESLFVSSALWNDEECFTAVSEQHLAVMETNTSLEGKRVSRFASNLLDHRE